MTLWGFFYNSCVYESADALQSLHFTKKGAYKAMRASKYSSELERQRPNYIMRGERGWVGKQPKPVDWRVWSVQPVEVVE